LVTPRPRKRCFTPSRSSHASCSPVLAPLGTMALPMLPPASVTTASTVGLPRESMTWRPWTRTICVIDITDGFALLKCQGGDSNPYGFLHQILSLARLPIPPPWQLDF